MAPASDFWPDGQKITQRRRGDQFSVLSGIASDDVARIELFLATGERLAIPLRGNAFVAPVARTSLPARLVAYDAAGAVIATQLTPSDG